MKLVPSKEIVAGEYIALSHCWGNLQPKEVPQHCTTTANINDRLEGFTFNELPSTFQDAIHVARCLKVHYLWIDSLCILQGEAEEATEDWKRESVCMEKVYASAYFTLAATSAVDSNSGFLKRNITTEYICFHDHDLDQMVYACTHPSDFDGEVEQAQLNTRAWVMQERFLSRRTIHFGANQMYWECGEGVYCEDLTQLKR